MTLSGEFTMRPSRAASMLVVALSATPIAFPVQAQSVDRSELSIWAGGGVGIGTPFPVSGHLGVSGRYRHFVFSYREAVYAPIDGCGRLVTDGLADKGVLVGWAFGRRTASTWLSVHAGRGRAIDGRQCPEIDPGVGGWIFAVRGIRIATPAVAWGLELLAGVNDRSSYMALTIGLYLGRF